MNLHKLFMLSIGAFCITACASSGVRPFDALTDEDFVEWEVARKDVQCSVNLYLNANRDFQTDQFEASDEEIALIQNSPFASLEGDRLSISGPTASSLRYNAFSRMQVIYQLTGRITGTDIVSAGLSVPTGAVTVGGNVSATNQAQTAIVARFDTEVDLSSIPNGHTVEDFCRRVRNLPPDAPSPTAETDPLARNLLALEKAVFTPNAPDGPIFNPTSYQLTGAFQVAKTQGGGISLSFLVFSFGASSTVSDVIAQQVTIRSELKKEEIANFLQQELRAVF